MTKNDALSTFRRTIAPLVRKHYGNKDKPAMREAWCIYIDGLCKDGRLVSNQVMNWTNPF